MEWKINNKSKYKNKLDKKKLEKRANIHSFHRYYGKLIPAIPSTFINEFTNEGDLIGDLFSGSGTVAVEAKLLNRNFVGCEINPLSHMISRVKTTTYDVNLLNKINIRIEEKLNNNNLRKSTKLDNVPYCVNIDHWFKKEVQNDLMYIKSIIDTTVNEYIKEKQEQYYNFYYSVISSIIRNVSNADPAHVFPGISKRIRQAEAEGKIKKDAIKTFINALKKRTKYFEIYEHLNDTNINIMHKNSVDANLQDYYEKVDLFVTNPPYISSVRYIETMKLEMYWLEYIKNSDEYGSLAKLMLGNDKVTKTEYITDISSKYDEIQRIINQIKEKSLKDSYIVAKYFNDMEKIIITMHHMLKKNGRIVLKISDSNVKKIKVETGKFLTLIAEHYGFELETVFLDKIENRSLTTARNTYSDIILNDYIIIWKKVGEIDVRNKKNN